MSPCTVSGIGRSSARAEPRGSSRDVLLRVERVAPRPLEERRLCLGRQDGRVEERGDEPCGLVWSTAGDSATVVELRLPPPHAGWRLVELRPRRAEDEDRQARRPVDETLDEREQRVVRPVQVLEEQDERADRRRSTSMKRCQAREGLLAIGLAAARQADERAEARPAATRASSAPGDGVAELRARFGRRVGLEDAGVGLDDLAERPERDAVAVGEAAALPPVRRAPARSSTQVAELREQARLADPGLAGDRDELDLRLAEHALERVLEQPELALAADERSRRCAASASTPKRLRAPIRPARRRPDRPCP